MFKLTGTLKVIKDTVQVTEKFSKREFVVSENSSMYPQEIAFQAAQDKCSMLDGFTEGEQVEVSFNLRGREWTSPQGEVKYFNTLDAWRIEKMGQGMPQSGPSDMNLDTVPTPQANTQSEADDDLPF
ncbi:MAG: DUF3127 domain-containing protein [Crocinitomicaceae bacterium]|jgi:hypothetical protein|nr:DUF3127 domain-containing protein [Crocinitomicaceae bacterium]